MTAEPVRGGGRGVLQRLDRARRLDLARLPWELRYVHAGRLATFARKIAIQATHRHCRIEFQGPVRLGPGFALDVPDQGTLVVGPGVDFRRGFVCEISGQGRVTIGAGTLFTASAMIQCTTSVDIGRRCMFARDVLIVDGNHRFRDPDVPVAAQGYDYRPITIGDDAAVMASSTVIADIGEHAFVGANSVVTRPIPDFCLAVGAPARVVEYFGPPDRRPAGLAVVNG
jgi:acetyltransferase-like isoleucine patch superfamily enzyme